MNSKDAIKALFESWNDELGINSKFSYSERKTIFLAEVLVGITTDDEILSLEFGKMILEVLIQIKERTTFEYIEDKECYRRYVLTYNLIENWLSCGTSIRGAWFSGRMECGLLMNIDYDEDYIEVTEDFMDWLIDWLLYD